MATPETRRAALEAWDRKETIDVVRIGRLDTNQNRSWTWVFEVLRAVPDMPPGSQVVVAGRTSSSVREGGWNVTTMQHFEALCFKFRVGFPPAYFKTPPQTPPSSEIEDFDAVRRMAYGIIRDGFAMTIQRMRGAGTLPLAVRKP